jgi:hypothetical protein
VKCSATTFGQTVMNISMWAFHSVYFITASLLHTRILLTSGYKSPPNRPNKCKAFTLGLQVCCVDLAFY